jgi:hypothetical protein
LAVHACGAGFRCHAHYLCIFGLRLGFLSLWDVVGGPTWPCMTVVPDFGATCATSVCGLLGGANLATRDCGAGFWCHTCNLHLAGYFGVVSRRGMFVEVLFWYASNLLFISNVYYLDLACVSAIVSFSSSFIPR